MLERHGVVTREAVLAEGVVGGFVSIYGVLKTMEERGQVRRGYFIDGLGAAQFAMPGAIDRLRDARVARTDAIDDDGAIARVHVLAATDPAQPFGAALPWPETKGRPMRSAGALVAIHAGEPLVWCDPRSHHLVVFPAGTTDTAWVEALVSIVKDGRRRGLEVRTVNGEDPSSHPGVVEALTQRGFAVGYRGLVLRD